MSPAGFSCFSMHGKYFRSAIITFHSPYCISVHLTLSIVILSTMPLPWLKKYRIYFIIHANNFAVYTFLIPSNKRKSIEDLRSRVFVSSIHRSSGRNVGSQICYDKVRKLLPQAEGKACISFVNIKVSVVKSKELGVADWPKHSSPRHIHHSVL